MLGVGLMVTIYAVCHDQYIVRIAPEHFTLYHEGYGHIGSPAFQAFLYAANASITPGIAFGLVLAIVCRRGKIEQISIETALRYALGVIVFAETLSLLTVLFVYLMGKPIYPLALYPDLKINLVITQSIQITCYIASFIGSGSVILHIAIMRW